MCTLPFLRMAGSDGPERTVELTGTTTIGRAADNDIVLSDETVSHCHAMLLTLDEAVFLMDLESTNGTFVNGVQAQPDELVCLADGDLVTIGGVMLSFRWRRSATER